MLIDWFTVIAQIVNFLILLGLLYRFLYKPILKTIDKRQRQMEDQWQAAEDAQEQAETEAQRHRQAQREIDEQRQQILAEAKAEAEKIRHAELQQIRAEIAQKRQDWDNALADEQQNILADLQHQFGQQVLAIVRRILNDLANADLEYQTIQAFQHKLQSLDDRTRNDLTEAFAHQHHAVTIQTGQELPTSTQNDLRQTLQNTEILNGQEIHFDVSPELIVGIHLQNDAYDLAWSAEDYLDDLARSLSQTLPKTSSDHPSENKHRQSSN